MKENIIKINKTYLKENGNYITIDLTYNNNKDITNELNILDRCINRVSYSNYNEQSTNIYEVISIIRTIFKDYNEDTIKVIFANYNDINSLVKYKNGDLVKYTSTNKLNREYKMLFDYSNSYGIKINFLGNIDSYKYNPTKDFNREYKLLTELNKNSKEFKKILSFDEIYIAKLYETTYLKKLDFNKKNMVNILTSSLFLLQNSFVNLPEDIYFCMSNNNIYSYNLYNHISNLMLFDNIDTSKCILYKDDISLIESIGKLLRENEEIIPQIASEIYDEKYRNINRNNETLEQKIKKLEKL